MTAAIRPGVALQMFSLRDAARADYPGTLRAIAGAGYGAIETAFGYGGLSASAFAALLKDIGLHVCATHVSSERLAAALDDEIAFNLAIGNRDLVCAELPLVDRADEGALRRWAEWLAATAESCRAHGARLSYHSHAFEFRRFGRRTGLEILLDEGGSDALQWEPDVYWLTFAGVDPSAWIGRYAARSRLLHLKDMRRAPLPPDPIEANTRDLAAHLSAPLGEGGVDFGPALRAATAAEWLIVEQDFTSGSMVDDISRSRAWLRATVPEAI